MTSDGEWSISPLLSPLDHQYAQYAPSILEAGLTSTLEYIKANKSKVGGMLQVRNALSLVRVRAGVKPSATTTAFSPVDKLLKWSGNKRLVLEVARLTINAAREAPPTEAVRKAKAKALICGLAWVYQRIGEFDEAERAAQESLQLGIDLNWDRNTAFCHKCIGRLRRIREPSKKRIRGLERGC